MPTVATKKAVPLDRSRTITDSSGNVYVEVVDVEVAVPDPPYDPKREACVRAAGCLAWIGFFSFFVQIFLFATGHYTGCHSGKCYYVDEKWSHIGQGFWAGTLFVVVGLAAMITADSAHEKPPKKSEIIALYVLLTLAAKGSVAMTVISGLALKWGLGGSVFWMNGLLFLFGVCASRLIIGICFSLYDIDKVAKRRQNRRRNKMNAQTKQQSSTEVITISENAASLI